MRIQRRGEEAETGTCEIPRRPSCGKASQESKGCTEKEGKCRPASQHIACFGQRKDCFPKGTGTEGSTQAFSTLGCSKSSPNQANNQGW